MGRGLRDLLKIKRRESQAAVVLLNFRSGSSFPVPVCTALHDIVLIKKTFNRTSRYNKVDAVRLYASNMLNLLLLKGQRWMELGF